ncbi:hypothetical protein C8F04DRAFT_1196699 [Mycena alexandri]|uniref:Uncharacterized protein n=1 Tax=Mycena alexandri TaxID=1745969 RepID=A0AAD6S3G0_9AGAR|nr:hypothetical protein C8F04DRAFT_1196699 [Mycena alexandri]
MDTFYDKDAATELDVISNESCRALSARAQDSVVHMSDLQLENIVVRETNLGRKNWKFCVVGDDSDVNDELVVRIQGMMTKNNLVPRNVQSCSPAKAQFLSQNIEICGGDSPTFAECIAKIASVHDRFEQQLAGVDVVPMADGVDNRRDLFAASNRIFTLKSDVPNEQDNTFQDGVDSSGLLHKLKRSDYIHAPENIVQYFRKKTPSGEGTVYVPFFPGGFKVGDLVELQVSFVAVAVTLSKVKVTTRLQVVTLLSSKWSNAATMARAAAAVKRIGQPAIRKRVGYYTEDEDEARKFKKSRTGSPAEDETMQ